MCSGIVFTIHRSQINTAPAQVRICKQARVCKMFVWLIKVTLELLIVVVVAIVVVLLILFKKKESQFQWVFVHHVND